MHRSDSSEPVVAQPNPWLSAVDNAEAAVNIAAGEHTPGKIVLDLSGSYDSLLDQRDIRSLAIVIFKSGEETHAVTLLRGMRDAGREDPCGRMSRLCGIAHIQKLLGLDEEARTTLSLVGSDTWQEFNPELRQKLPLAFVKTACLLGETGNALEALDNLEGAAKVKAHIIASTTLFEQNKVNEAKEVLDRGMLYLSGLEERLAGYDKGELLLALGQAYHSLNFKEKTATCVDQLLASIRADLQFDTIQKDLRVSNYIRDAVRDPLVLCVSAGRLAEAHALFEEVKDHFVNVLDSGDPRTQSICLSQIAMAAAEAGLYEEAAKIIFTEFPPVMEKCDEVFMLHSCGFKAFLNLAIQMKQTDDAQRILALKQKFTGRDMRDEVNVASSFGDEVQCQEYLEAIIEKLNPDERRYALELSAKMAHRAGFTTLRDMYADRLERESESPHGMMYCGKLNASFGRFEKAKELLAQVLPNIQAIRRGSSVSDIIDSHITLADFHREAQDTLGAQHVLHAALNWLRELAAVAVTQGKYTSELRINTGKLIRENVAVAFQAELGKKIDLDLPLSITEHFMI